MVRDGADAAIIRARLAHGERQVLLEVQLNRQGSNKARVNGAPVKTTELPRYAQVVLFAPEDLQIVRGDPSSRRRFADQLLVQRTPAPRRRARRLRPRAQAAHRAAEVGEGTRHPRRRALDPRRVGRQARRARHRGHRGAPRPRRRPRRARSRAAYAAIAGADHRPEIEWALSVRGGDPEEGAGEPRPDATLATTRDIARAVPRRRSPPAAPPSSIAASRSSARTATISCCGCAGFRSRDTPRTASRGRSPSRLRLASAELLRAESRLGDPVLILDDVFAELDTDRRARLADLVGRLRAGHRDGRGRGGCAGRRCARASCASRPGTILEAADA